MAESPIIEAGISAEKAGGASVMVPRAKFNMRSAREFDLFHFSAWGMRLIFHRSGCSLVLLRGGEKVFGKNSDNSGCPRRRRLVTTKRVVVEAVRLPFLAPEKRASTREEEWPTCFQKLPTWS
jgi:hypothetical protein